VPSNRLGPSDRPTAWAPFVPCNACFIAAPSKTQHGVSTPFTTSSPAAM
jgi:hypothetical protein